MMQIFSSGNPGHMFNNVAPGDHTVTVACSTNSGSTISKTLDVSVSGKGTYCCKNNIYLSSCVEKIYLKLNLGIGLW